VCRGESENSYVKAGTFGIKILKDMGHVYLMHFKKQGQREVNKAYCYFDDNQFITYES
jgi:hypothetical protein